MRSVKVLGRGRFPAKTAESLVQGDIIMRPSGRAVVLDAPVVEVKTVHFHLQGLDVPYQANLWHKRRTLVALGSRPAPVEQREIGL